MKQVRLCLCCLIHRELAWLVQKPHTVLDKCLNMLLSCCRKRMSASTSPKALAKQSWNRHRSSDDPFLLWARATFWSDPIAAGGGCPNKAWDRGCEKTPHSGTARGAIHHCKKKNACLDSNLQMVPILKKANNGLPPIFLWRDRHAGQIYDKRVIPESSPFFGIIRGIVIECSMGSLAICNSVQFNRLEIPNKKLNNKERPVAWLRVFDSRRLPTPEVNRGHKSWGLSQSIMLWARAGDGSWWGSIFVIVAS